LPINSIRWGLIGAGDIVRKRVAAALRDCPGSELVAVSRAQADRVDAFAREIGAQRGVRDWRTLVADPEIDAVYIATPVSVHAEQTVAAAEAGKHVLCEKPMAMSAAECDRMIAACGANGVTLGIAYYRRFYPVVSRIKQMLVDGEIGRPVLGQVHAFEPFDPPPDHPRRWLLDPAESGGGPMMDFGCHRLEVLVNLFGRVSRTAPLAANVVFDREVEDTAAVLLQFDGGPCASVAVTHAAAERQDTLHVFGTRGSIHCADLNRGEIVVRLSGAERSEYHPPADNVHRPLIDDFAEAVFAGRPPAVDGLTGRAVAAIEDDIYGLAPSVR